MANLVSKFKKWLKKVKPIPNEQQNNKANTTKDKAENFITSNLNVSEINNFNKIKIYENKGIIIYLQKTIHKRLKRFKFLDNLFLIKVEIKDNKKVPFLKDLLDTFDNVFNFILSHIKTYFRAEDHNVAYLTLAQDPMVNGINTGNKKNLFCDLIVNVMFINTNNKFCCCCWYWFLV